MKIKHFMLAIFALIIFGGIFSVVFQYHRFKTNVGNFILIEYQWEIENFSTEQNIGEIIDKNDAVEKAASIWLEQYGICVQKKNIKVDFDSSEDCWHVYNSTPKNQLGGVYHAIIQTNGNLVAVWAED